MDTAPAPGRDGTSPSLARAAAPGALILILGLGAILVLSRAERAGPRAGKDAVASRASAEPEAAPPVLQGQPAPGTASLDDLSPDLRREIFVAHHRARTDAEEAAEAIFPWDRAPDDPDSRKLYLSKRDAIIEKNEDSGRRSLLNRYGITPEQLAAIDDEGLTNRWTYTLPEDVEQDATRGYIPGRRTGKGGGGGGRGRSGGGGRRH